jgi:biopolymer transport protein TolQ
MSGIETPLVRASEISGSVAASDMSIISLISGADIVVKIVMLSLILTSVWCWTIIFNKIITYRDVKSKTEHFERKFWSGQLLSQLYERLKVTGADHPLAYIFIAAMNEWGHASNSQNSDDGSLKVGIKDRIYQAMVVAGNREIDKLSSSLSVLATVNSAATYVGLFGTVWGIMHAFQSIAASKNTTLAVVAPGIAEALLATAFGLIAAIPAGIFYNYLSAKLNHITSRIDNFASEVSNLLSREIDQGRA